MSPGEKLECKLIYKYWFYSLISTALMLLRFPVHCDRRTLERQVSVQGRTRGQQTLGRLLCLTTVQQHHIFTQTFCPISCHLISSHIGTRNDSANNT